MSFGGFLFASLVGTALTFRKELSSEPRIVYIYDPFPDCATEEQKRLYERMESGYANRQYDTSIEAAEKLMQWFPNCPWLYMRRAMCYGQISRYDEGIADFVHALELDGASDGGKNYVLGPNREKVLDDIELMKNMRLAHLRALAQVASQAETAKAPTTPPEIAASPRKRKGASPSSGSAARTPKAGTASGACAGKTTPKRRATSTKADSTTGTSSRRKATKKE